MNEGIKISPIRISIQRNKRKSYINKNRAFKSLERSIFTAESLDYSTLELDAVNGKFQKIQVEARYSAVKLALPSSASFQVKGENLKYGHCKLLGFEPTKSEKEKDAVYYEVNGGKNGSIYFDAGGYSNMNIRKE